MKIRYIVLILFFSACSKHPESHFDKNRRKITHKVMKEFIIEMKAKGFEAAGIGEGIDHNTNKQNYLSVTFDVDSLPNVEYARKLEVEALSLFLKYINEKNCIEEYLVEYPFSNKFVRVAFISCHSENGLFSVSNFEDEITYYAKNPENMLSPSYEVHTESFQDAESILKSGLEVLSGQK